MTFKLSNTYIQIKFLFVALITFLMFVDESGIFIFCYLSSLIHELGHIVAVYICGDKIDRIVFDIYGILIHKQENLSYSKQLFILLLGPFVNIIIGFLFGFSKLSWAGFFAASNMVLGIFNLLPISGLDGGEIVSIVLEYFLGDRISRVVSVLISVAMLLPMAFLCFYNFMEKKGNFSLVIVFVFLTVSLLRTQKAGGK